MSRRTTADVPRALGTQDGHTTYGARRQVLTFVRTGVVHSVAKGAADAGAVVNFTLDDVSSYSEFTALFDEYRITKAEVCMFWTPGSTPAQFPNVLSAIDYDGTTAPAAYTDVTQYSTFKITAFNTANTVANWSVLRPGANLSTFTGNASPVRSPWVDCSAPSQPHYGLVWWLGTFNTAVASGSLAYHVRYTLQFRTSR
jgi:hypothetical protein